MTIGDVVVTHNSDGAPTEYRCGKLVGDNKQSLIPVQFRFYYDLRYGTAQEEGAVVKCIEDLLLEEIAREFGVMDGKACGAPPIDGSIWMVSISSDPEDLLVKEFETCQELDSSDPDYSCQVYEGKMLGNALGVDDETTVFEFVNMIMGSGLVPLKCSSADAYFLGTTITNDADGDPVIPVNNAVNPKSRPSSSNDRRTVTIIGGLLVAAFVLAFLVLLLVFYRRRRRIKHARDVELALSKSGLDFGDGHSGDEAKTFEQDILDDDVIEGSDMHGESYTFDLGTSLRNELFGVYGEKATPRNPPNGMEETSDSDADADSWAQTDGTIGSLELQLEPITAEV